MGTKNFRKVILENFVNFIHQKYISVNLMLFSSISTKNVQPTSLHITPHPQEISIRIDAYCNKYENILIMGDLNVDVKEVNLYSYLL